MTFGNPPMLTLLLFTVLCLIAFLIWAWKRRQKHIRQFVRSRLLAHLTVGVSATRRKVRLMLLVVAVGCVILALARPRWGYTLEEVRQRGLDIVVAVDTSRSMLAEDVAPNRLTRAKLAALELIPRAKTDRLGLVAFAGTAFLQCPLTLDEEAFRQNVNILDVGLIPQAGTALGEAILTSLSAFKNDENNEKIIVLMTDGEDHEQGAMSAAERAAREGVRIFTIGVGTSQGELLRQRDTNGAEAFIKDEEGNVVKSHLNESLLRQIAEAANGFYLPLRGANTIDTLYARGLAPLLAHVRETDQKPGSVPLIRRYHERFQWPLGLAILLLLTELFIPDRKLARRPLTPMPNTTQPELARVVALFLVGLLPLGAQGASASKAQRLYEEGQYRSAWQEYQHLSERNPKDARLAFNAGAAAYQAKEYEEAARNFDDALRAKEVPLQQRAYYNLGNALFRQGQQEQDLQKRSSLWEQAIKHYDSAMKLDAKDADAKYNADLVKKLLEQLKQQQKQQQDQQQKNKPDDKKQDDQKSGKDQDKNKEREKKEQQQKQQDQQKQDQQKQEQQKQDQPPKPENKDNSQKKEQPKPNQDQPGQTNQTNQAQQQMPPPDGKMTPQQARQLLDAEKNDEPAMRFMPLEKTVPRSRKDW